jgi:hypothetical protein
MDKAPAYGAGDSRFDPWHVQFYAGEAYRLWIINSIIVEA